MLSLIERPRRLRRSAALRALVAEATLSADDFVMPCFVRDGQGIDRPIGAMPGIHQFSVDLLLEDLAPCVERGLKAVLLFGLPELKDGLGRAGWDPNGPVPRATSALKRRYPDLVVMADVCLCEYTDHGHCGPLRTRTVQGVSVADVDNDAAVEGYCKESLAYAAAGADVIAPSGMMDGMVGAIRSALDGADFTDVAIMAYSAKYASSFYGPFREAAECAPKSGDRKTYQMNPANAREAMRELALDAEQGADILMIKPALAYLDIIAAARQNFDLPIAAYNVSGEYSMVKAAVEKGWLSPDAAWESLLSMKRAGADILISYFARDFFLRDDRT